MHKLLFDEEPYTCDPPGTPAEQGNSLVVTDGYALLVLFQVGLIIYSMEA